MRRLRRYAAVASLVLAAACGIPGAAPDDQTLSAAGAAGAEPAAVPSTSTTTSVVVTTVAPATTAVPTTTTTKVKSPVTTAAPSARGTAPAPTTPPAPAPAPATAPIVAAVPTATTLAVPTTVTEGPTTVTLKAVREQYLGEAVNVWAEATSTERITSVSIDFGDGYVTTKPNTEVPASVPQSAWANRAHAYAAAGPYRITARVTVVPGLPFFMPGGDGSPSWVWIPSGPEHTVSVGADFLQRSDQAPANYPRLPTVMGA